jgi:hypothetical protein
MLCIKKKLGQLLFPQFIIKIKLPVETNMADDIHVSLVATSADSVPWERTHPRFAD